MSLILSLFPGIGLLDRAFEEEGFVVVRGPDVLWGGDVRSFHPPAGKFDGIIGGPPCQCFSTLANLVRAKGLEPHFGNLIPEYVRCVDEALPDWFLMENVPAAPEPLPAKYAVTSFLLNNAWLGEEQRRRRRFSFGVRGKAAPILMRWIEQAPLELPHQAATVICKGGVQAKTGTAMQGGASVRTDDRRVCTARYNFADACRLQGLPEDFLADAPFTAQGKLKAVANGVPLPMGRAVARAVKEALAR